MEKIVRMSYFTFKIDNNVLEIENSEEDESIYIISADNHLKQLWDIFIAL